MEGRREQKKRLTKTRIGAAAVDVVSEAGMGSARLEEICERAGVGRSTFFRYFDSKESAFVTGVLEGRCDAILSELAARPGDESAFDALRATFVEVIARGDQLRETLVLEHRIRTESPTVYARAAAYRQSMDQPIAALLESRVSGAANAALQARLLARLGITTAHLASDRWIEEGAEGSPRRYVVEAFDAVVDLMRASI